MPDPRRTLPFLLLLGLVAVIPACAPAYPSPPETATEPVVDVIHGEEIVDPYRWLEDQDAAETRAWIDAQNAYAEQILEPTAELRERFRDRLEQLSPPHDVGRPIDAGERQLFTLRRAGEPTAAIVARPEPAADDAEPPTPDGEYEIIVDPLAIRPDGTSSVGIVEVSPDGELLAYRVRDGGKDEVSIHVRDLSTGEDLPDVLPEALYGGVRFDAAGEGLLYVHRSRSEGPRLRYHRLGTPLEQDPTIFGDGVAPTAFLSASPIEDLGMLLIEVQHGWARNDAWLLPVADDGHTPTGDPVPIVEGLDAHFDFAWREGRLWVRTDHQAPNWRLAIVDPADPAPASLTTVLPEGDEPLASFTLIGERLYATYLRDVGHRVEVFDLQGRSLADIAVPPHSRASLRGAGEGVLALTVESFALPETTWHLDLESGERTLEEEPAFEFDPAGLMVEQLWASSADGTRVPLFVIRRADLELDGRRPTLLVGYGGFNVANLPSFGAQAIAWTEGGGVYAVANLRGGGEYGERWHRGGMLENKQNVFDDFIAAAERLVEGGYTVPGRLAISGTSNGGLLMGAVITQRPDLFRAAKIGFPDLDMVRFVEFEETNNKPALLEYGDASDPAQFAFLRAYSPYQAVEEGVEYPAVVLTSGDLDTRVPPLQARKMTARLQTATGSGLPVILRYDPRAGHAGGRTRARGLDDAAAELAFLWWQLHADGQPES